jgi:ketosteroid isomerase-like protein
MRLIVGPVVALLLASCGTQTNSRAPGSDQTDESLVRFADAFDRAQLDKDEAALERMVSDDLVFIDRSGKRQGKREFIAGWTAEGDSFDPVALVDRVVRQMGPDAGLVSAEAVLSGVSGGARFSSRFRYSDVFRREQGEWRAVHIQVTPMPDGATP